MRQNLLPLYLILLILPPIWAATLHGNVYDVEFDLLENVVVEINTTPKQTYVARDGTYSFEVQKGEYLLRASLPTTSSLEEYAQEYVSITADGSYIVDLFTFPELKEEEFTEDLPEEITIETHGDSQPAWRYIFSAIAAALIIFWFLKKYFANRVSGASHNDEGKEALPIHEPAGNQNLDDDLKSVLSILTKEGGRMNQKELRRELPLSEAKISLLVTELEYKGLIEKIKRGRANILILKQRKA